MRFARERWIAAFIVLWLHICSAQVFQKTTRGFSHLFFFSSFFPTVKSGIKTKWIIMSDMKSISNQLQSKKESLDLCCTCCTAVSPRQHCKFYAAASFKRIIRPHFKSQYISLSRINVSLAGGARWKKNLTNLLELVPDVFVLFAQNYSKGRKEKKKNPPWNFKVL